MIDIDDLQTWLVDGDDPVPIFAHSDSDQPTLSFQAEDGTFLQGGQLEGVRRRVVLERYDYTVVGWAPANRLRLPTGFGFGSGGGESAGGQIGTALKRQRHDLSCDRPIDLHVELGGQRDVVGRLEAKRPFWVDDLEPAVDGWRPVHLDDDPVELIDGATWVVAEVALTKCGLL